MYFDENLEIKKCAVILRIIRTICVHLLIPLAPHHTAMTDYCWGVGKPHWGKNDIDFSSVIDIMFM